MYEKKSIKHAIQTNAQLLRHQIHGFFKDNLENLALESITDETINIFDTDKMPH